MRINIPLTHEQFLEKLPKDRKYEVLGEYKSAKEKILIRDNYGECLVSTINLVKNNKPNIRSAINKTEYFINQAKEVHGDRYDYSKFIYNGSLNKSTIICKIHGEFVQTCSLHLQGRGCLKCGKIDQSLILTKTTKDFIIDSQKTHGDKYFYDKVNYTYSLKAVTIGCKTHGYFDQIASAHIRGAGCKLCAIENSGWNKEKSIRAARGRKSTFYIIKCFNENEEFYKIGRTVDSVKSRYAGLKAINYEYEIIKEVKGEAGWIFDLEVKYKRILKKEGFHYKPENFFKGCVTECFSNVKLLLSDIENNNF